MARVFLSYRRQDNRWAAGRIYDHLVQAWGPGEVFMDIAGMPAGVDFRAHIRHEMVQCDLVLVAMAADWRRILAERRENPLDYVRLEIELALELGLPLVPLLLGRMDEVRMPSESDLPPSIRGLAHRHALRVAPDEDFHDDIARLVAAIAALRETRHRPSSFRTAEGIEMTGVPSGRFWMGATPGDAEAAENEGPRREVTFPQGFWLSATPVTVAQYRAVMGEEAWQVLRARYPDSPTFETHLGPDKPVANLTQAEARAFATAVERKEAHRPLGYRYRLPTGEEWEYACRGGSPDNARHGDLERIAWTASTSGEAAPFSAVGRKQANGWGFHDMLGLVFEWCEGPPSGGQAEVRGGSYQDGPDFARASARVFVRPDKTSSRIGFRLALALDMGW